MQTDKTDISEVQILDKLNGLFASLGFEIRNDNRGSIQTRNPDIIAQKKVDNSIYKIAVEIKGGPAVAKSINHGIETLTNIEEPKSFDRLVLVVQDFKNGPPSFSKAISKFQHENPSNLEILNLTDLNIWFKNLNIQLNAEKKDEVFHYIKQLSKKLIELVAKNPENLRKLEWRDLERTVSELFEGLGFDVTLTPCSKDGGKDVVLECLINNLRKSYIVEIKHWKSGQKVGKKAVKEFTQVIINEKREKGLFLSTYGFACNYYESLAENEKKLVNFGDKEKIIELCRTYEKVNNGIWNPISSMENILFSGTVSHYK
jgi:restriction system protein